MPPRRGPQAEVEAENSEVNPTQQLVDILLGVLQGHPIGQPNENTPKTTIFKDFKSVGPPEFRGTAKPIEAQGWIIEIEKVFTITNVGEDQKTVFATFFLKGEANYWWEANRTRAGVGIVTWDRFKELFFENFFPQSMQDRMEVQFLELRQGELTVSQYTAKFNELARFAPHQVDSEARKTRRYEEGLKPQIRSKLSVFQVKTFPEILEKAIIAENENEALIKFHKDKSNQNEGGRFKGEAITGGFNNNKRKWDTTFANNSGKRGNNYNDNKNNNKRIDPCVTCGKNHRGVCFNKRITCHSCGQEGHYAF